MAGRRLYPRRRVSGSRTGMVDPYARYLAIYGYVAVAPSYRLAPITRSPRRSRMCERRGWLRRHAREYDIDPDRIGAMGLSAGGHLSLMLGLCSDQDRFGPDDVPEKGESARVQAVVNYFGPGDMAAKDWPDLAVHNYLVPFLGGMSAERPDNYRQASPITYITRDDPPVLTFQGDKDVLVPISLARDLHKRLSAIGVTNELQVLAGQGHGWGEPHLTCTRQLMVRFFAQHLKGDRLPVSRPAADATSLSHDLVASDVRKTTREGFRAFHE